MPFNPTEYVCIDTETTGLRHWHGDQPFAVSMCDQDGEPWYCEWAVDPFTRKVTPNEEDLLFLQGVFLREDLPKILFNAKFDYRMLLTVGLELKGEIHDVGVVARICNTNEFNYKLKPLALKYAGISLQDEEELQKEVNSCRRIARKKGWLVHEDTAADYWLPRLVNPRSKSCEKYALIDVERTRLLWLMYRHVVMKETPVLWDTYRFEMFELWPIINELEARGVAIDRKKNAEELRKATEKRDRELAALRAMLIRDKKKWSDKPGVPFNPGSPIMLARILYDAKDGYGLECSRRTKPSAKNPEGNLSTDWKALREHLTHGFVQVLVQFRSAEKAVTTYFGNYEKEMITDHLNPAGDCIHGSFNQLGANKTSRLSANSPNLQNAADSNNNPNSPAPIQAREPFIPRPGYRLYCIDYSGQEVRIFAEVAGIEEMLKSILSGRDVMADTANRAWGGKGNERALQAAAYSLELGSLNVNSHDIKRVWQDMEWNTFKAKTYGYDSPQSKRVADQWLAGFGYDIVKAEKSIGQKRTRTRAKNLTYAKIYGAGANGVMDMLYCTRADAKAQLKLFDELFPGMPRYINQLSSESAELGYVETLFGRRLDVESNYAYRAVNYKVQGTGADMIKRGMVRTSAYLKKTGLDAHLLMPIHDELVFEVRIEHAYKWLLRGCCRIMEGVGAMVMKTPMPVECNRVRRFWSQKEPVTL